MNLSEIPDPDMIPEYYREFQENHYLDVDIKQVTGVICKPEAEDKKWTNFTKKQPSQLFIQIYPCFSNFG